MMPRERSRQSGIQATSLTTSCTHTFRKSINYIHHEDTEKHVEKLPKTAVLRKVEIGEVDGVGGKEAIPIHDDWTLRRRSLRDVAAPIRPVSGQYEDLERLGDDDLYKKNEKRGERPAEGVFEVERQTEDKSTDQEGQTDDCRQADHQHEEPTCYRHSKSSHNTSKLLLLLLLLLLLILILQQQQHQ